VTAPQRQRQQRITPADLEAKFRELKTDVDDTTATAKSYVVPAGIGLAVLVILIAFLLGKRRGKNKSSVVEIRRL
jgi:hypothetical protein